MIRHIVFFKLRPGTSREQEKELVTELYGLKKKISHMRDIEVARDVGCKPNSYDIALNTLFDSMEAVEKYAAHPAHVKVLELINRLCESTVKVDYATDKVAM